MDLSEQDYHNNKVFRDSKNGELLLEYEELIAALPRT